MFDDKVVIKTSGCQNKLAHIPPEFYLEVQVHNSGGIVERLCGLQEHMLKVQVQGLPELGPRLEGFEAELLSVRQVRAARKYETCALRVDEDEIACGYIGGA